MKAPKKMPTLVVGGCAAGTVLRLRVDAGEIELSAPLYAKPIATPDPDAEIEFEIVRDTYEVHPLALTNTDSPDRASLVGLAVVKGTRLTDAFAELINAYCQVKFAEAVQKRLDIPQPKAH